jgi:predicted amidohydrolase
MTVRVALAQVEPVTGDKAANLAKFCAFMDEARREGAQLVVFPELALTGYACGDRFFALAEPVPGPSTERLAAEARARDLHVVFGMPEAGLPGVLYNAAVLVGPEGHIGTWRKHTLPGHATDQAGPGAFPDRRYFRAAAASPVFDTRLGRLGLLVCYDVFFPELARLLTLKGADLLVAVSGSPAFERPIFEPLVKARAMENAVWLAYCNVGGTEGGVAYWGGSRLIGPGDPERKVPGEPVACQAPYDREALVVGEVDYERTRRFRPFFPVLRDLSPALYDQLAAAALD